MSLVDGISWQGLGSKIKLYGEIRYNDNTMMPHILVDFIPLDCKASLSTHDALVKIIKVKMSRCRTHFVVNGS